MQKAHEIPIESQAMAFSPFFSRRLAWSSAYCRWKAASIPWASASRTAPWCRGNATWQTWLDFAGSFGDFVGDSREKTWNTCALGMMKFRVTEQRWHGESSWILVSHEHFLRNRVISLELNPLVDDLPTKLGSGELSKWLAVRERFRSSQSSPKSTSTGLRKAMGSGDFSEAIFKDSSTSTFFNQRST